MAGRMSDAAWDEEFVLRREDVPEEFRALWDRALVLPVPDRALEEEEEHGDSNKAE